MWDPFEKWGPGCHLWPLSFSWFSLWQDLSALSLKCLYLTYFVDVCNVLSECCMTDLWSKLKAGVSVLFMPSAILHHLSLIYTFQWPQSGEQQRVHNSLMVENHNQIMRDPCICVGLLTRCFYSNGIAKFIFPYTFFLLLLLCLFVGFVVFAGWISLVPQFFVYESVQMHAAMRINEIKLK